VIRLQPDTSTCQHSDRGGFWGPVAAYQCQKGRLLGLTVRHDKVQLQQRHRLVPSGSMQYVLDSFIYEWKSQLLWMMPLCTWAKQSLRF